VLLQLINYISGIIFFLLHVTGAGSFPKTLTAAEERKCLDEMKNGSREARQKLIEHNLRLVAHVIKKYYAGANDNDDLISIGTIGLIKAIDSFNPDKGIRLSSYASKCVEKATQSLRLF
jgi:RNA polymerase sporulation-specific sigma factor